MHKLKLVLVVLAATAVALVATPSLAFSAHPGSAPTSGNTTTSTTAPGNTATTTSTIAPVNKTTTSTTAPVTTTTAPGKVTAPTVPSNAAKPVYGPTSSTTSPASPTQLRSSLLYPRAPVPYNPTGWYSSPGTASMPDGGGFCVTPGANAPGNTAYTDRGFTFSGSPAESATVMWLANNYGLNGIPFNNSNPPNAITLGGLPAATASTGYGGASLNAVQTTVTAEQIANDVTLNVNDTDHSTTDTALVNGFIAFAQDYPGPWYLALNGPTGPFSAGTAYTYTATVTASNGATVPVYGLTVSQVATTNSTIAYTGNSATTGNSGQGGVMQFSVTPTGSGSFKATVGSQDLASGASAIWWNGITGYQVLVPNGASAYMTTVAGTVQPTASTTGSLQVFKSGNDMDYYPVAGAQFFVEQLAIGYPGFIPYTAVVTIGSNGYSPVLTVPVGNYNVSEQTPPNYYFKTEPQIVTVNPRLQTTVSFSGQYQDEIQPTAIAAQKVATNGGAPLEGAAFDFKYSQYNNGVYNQDLGTCTTGSNGTCSPPNSNYPCQHPGADQLCIPPVGWQPATSDVPCPTSGACLELPGSYQITEVSAPSGYYLQGPSVQTIYAVPFPPSTVTATFSDPPLGSLKATKTGNDTAYWPISGAVFNVTGPSPSTASVGTLTIGANGQSNTITDLQPGTYTVTETTAPPGYQLAPSQTVNVPVGPTVTTVSFTDSVKPGNITLQKLDGRNSKPLAGAVFSVGYDAQDNGSYTSIGTCTTDTSGTCSPPPNDGTGFLPGDYQFTETTAPSGYQLPSPAIHDAVLNPGASLVVTYSDAETVSMTTQVPASTATIGTKLSDSLTVSGLSSGYATTVNWQVLGPAAPISGSCAQVNWTGIATFASGTVSITGSGTYNVTAPNAPTLAGCYTWAYQLAASGGNTEATQAPGATSETVMLTPNVTTALSANGETVPATISDSVTAQGFSSMWPTTITWHLYGPIPATSGSCANVNWAGAQSTESGTIQVTSSTTVPTPAVAVTSAGCYTFSESWPGGATPPGIAAETVLLTSAPTPGSGSGSGSASNGGNGNSISGGAGQGGLLINTGGGLMHSHYTYLPTAFLTLAGFSLIAMLRRRKKALIVLAIVFALAAAGIWYHNNHSTSSAGARPAPYETPAHPSAAQPPGAPIALAIPALGIHAPVVTTQAAVVSGVKQLLIPADVHTVGWWNGSVTPGSAGTALIAGHINWVGQGPGALANLAEARSGEQVIVTADNGATTTWQVASTQLLPKAVVAAKTWPRNGPRALALVTCGGPFNPADGQYADNVVVIAKPIATAI